MRGDRYAVSPQFGRNLAEVRGWTGVTQHALACEASMHQRDICRFEAGLVCPRLDTVVRLAEALEIQVRDLLYGIE